MKFQESFQCKACSSYLSHPIDTCPVCGDQFYWLVHPHRPPVQDERDAYVSRMQTLVEGKATPEFMTHGNLLWLPHRFWDFNPTGEVLNEFEWLREVELVQHDGEDREEQKPNVWDTLPGRPVPDLSIRETVKGKAVETLRADPLPSDPVEARAVVSRRDKLAGHLSAAEVPGQTAPTGRSTSASAPPSGKAIIPKQMFAPLMILIFFIFLSGSYIVLRYHKNTSAIPLEDVTNESTVLP
ncbi:MAG: hypothetical protein QNK37_24000 [Acidobacteriota bacterium]|nr:hypothetical protein [Acidobacteriota bacterium]